MALITDADADVDVDADADPDADPDANTAAGVFFVVVRLTTRRGPLVDMLLE